MKDDRLRGRVGVLWVAALGTSVVACGGIVPIGNGPGDGGNGAPAASITQTNGNAADGYGGSSPTDGADAGEVLLEDAGISVPGPDASIVLSDDAGQPGDSGIIVFDATWTDGADTPDAWTAGLDGSAQCALSISSEHYAEDPLVCDSCMAQSCCAENDVCGSNPDCAALISCAALCEMDGGSSASCDSECIQEHGAGGAAYVALMQCMDSSCDLQACFPLF
ncbi:MAG TPA: hypothetical protein VGL81_32165 [Polyangiaceae bacterium]|jgi:hypothetical protein